MTGWLRRWLSRPNAFWWIAVLAVLLTLPSLGAGYFYDDYIHRLAAVGHPDVPFTPRPPYDLFTFSDGNEEHVEELNHRMYGMWMLAKDFKIAFMRPVTSLSHTLDYRWWPAHPWLMHLQNMLWYVLLLLVVSRLYRRFLGVGFVASLATLLYAIDDTHGFTVGWLANRYGLMAAVFSFCALYCYVRREEEDWAQGAWLGPIFLTIGLLSGESGIGVLAYLLAFVLCLSRRSWKRRIQSLVPYAVVVLGWRILFDYLDRGTAGTGFYIDPLHEPFVFVEALLQRFPVLFLAQWGGAAPAELQWWGFFDSTRVVISIQWILLLLALTTLVWPLIQRDRRARFLAVGSLIAAVPICATMPQDRLLLFVGFGASGIVALVLDEAGGLIRQAKSAIGRLSRRAGLVYLTVCHIVLAPVLLPVRTLAAEPADRVMAQAGRSLPDDEAFENQQLVAVVTATVFRAFPVLLRRAAMGERLPASVRYLAITKEGVEVARDDRQSLTLTVRGGLLDGRALTSWRDSHQIFSRGDVFRLRGLVAEVLEVTPAGQAEKVRFRFPVPLEHQSLRLVIWKHGGFVPFKPPAVGESTFISAYVPD